MGLCSSSLSLCFQRKTVLISIIILQVSNNEVSIYKFKKVLNALK